jgi:glutamate racemase
LTSAAQPIGIFDSGIGGLSVLRHLEAFYPHEHLLYFADQAHVPYGSRTAEEIRHYSAEITRFLLDQGAKIIVVACNTASAAALNYLRQTFPEVRIVGMEPAVKPAAAVTRTGKVGVLATPGTFASPRYAALMERFTDGVTVLEDPCVGLVKLIEAGQLDTPATKQLLQDVLRPMVAEGVDTIVLGCTHYPFVRPIIETILAVENENTAVTIIDPAPAVARQVGRVLVDSGFLAPPSQVGVTRLFTTGERALFSQLSEQLLGKSVVVVQVNWRGSKLETVTSGSL